MTKTQKILGFSQNFCVDLYNISISKILSQTNRKNVYKMDRLEANKNIRNSCFIFLLLF